MDMVKVTNTDMDNMIILTRILTSMIKSLIPSSNEQHLKRMGALNMQHYFTLSEANALIPLVTVDIEKLQDIKRQFREKYEELQQLKAYFQKYEPPIGRDPFFTLECELDFLQVEGNAIMQSFELKGVQLKDIDSGLVDFPALLDGQQILLCWRQGEQTITHYHGLNEGFAGRRKLAQE
jgi:hypothetical protein